MLTFCYTGRIFGRIRFRRNGYDLTHKTSLAGFIPGIGYFSANIKRISVRRILIDDPEFIFPPALQQVAVYRSMQSTSDVASTLAKKKMNVSLRCLLALPEFPPFLFSLGS